MRRGLLIIALLLVSCNESPPKKTDKDLEQEHPLNYLQAQFSYDRHYLLGNYDITISIVNTAKFAEYKDIVYRVTWLTESDTPVHEEDYSIYKYFPPGQTVTFEKDVWRFDNAKKVSISIISAVIAQLVEPQQSTTPPSTGPSYTINQDTTRQLVNYLDYSGRFEMDGGSPDIDITLDIDQSEDNISGHIHYENFSDHSDMTLSVIGKAVYGKANLTCYTPRGGENCKAVIFVSNGKLRWINKTDGLILPRKFYLGLADSSRLDTVKKM
jgi:hypothetical protein